ncbi:MAG: hypothetical protein FJZ85_06480 [Chloroflexi bacterium]|nr:hypothetical protein [Chloroflexota bacterium]
MYKISVCYPKKWGANKVKTTDPAVLWFSDPAPSTPPFFTIVATKAADHQAALFTATKIAVESAGGPGSYKEGSVKVLTTTDAKTADGTAMKEFETQGDVLGFALKGYNAVALKGDTYIVIAVNTVDIMSPYKKDQFAEVVRTLTFK